MLYLFRIVECLVFRQVAKRIGTQLNDETLNLFEKIRTSDFSELRSSRPWIIAAPLHLSKGMI